jgi:polyhydroxyalkanoate synthesis regulator phasin
MNMSDFLKKAFSLGLGLTLVSKEKVEQIVDDLVKRGELAPAESKALVEKLLDRGDEEQARLKDWINEQVANALKQTGMASTKDVEELTRRVAELEIKLSELQHP